MATSDQPPKSGSDTESTGPSEREPGNVLYETTEPSERKPGNVLAGLSVCETTVSQQTDVSADFDALINVFSDPRLPEGGAYESLNEFRRRIRMTLAVALRDFHGLPIVATSALFDEKTNGDALPEALWVTHPRDGDREGFAGFPPPGTNLAPGEGGLAGDLLSRRLDERRQRAAALFIEWRAALAAAVVGAKGDGTRVWTKPWCPSCGRTGLKWLTKTDFAKQTPSKRNPNTKTKPSTVAERVKRGEYWHDGSGLIPWCETCREKTPRGTGAERPVDAAKPEEFRPTTDQAKELADYVKCALLGDPLGFDEDDVDTTIKSMEENAENVVNLPKTQARIGELLNVGIEAALKLCRERGGMPGGNECIDVVRRQMVDYLKKDEESLRHSKGDIGQGEKRF